MTSPSAGVDTREAHHAVAYRGPSPARPGLAYDGDGGGSVPRRRWRMVAGLIGGLVALVGPAASARAGPAAPFADPSAVVKVSDEVFVAPGTWVRQTVTINQVGLPGFHTRISIPPPLAAAVLVVTADPPGPGGSTCGRPDATHWLCESAGVASVRITISYDGNDLALHGTGGAVLRLYTVSAAIVGTTYAASGSFTVAPQADLAVQSFSRSPDGATTLAVEISNLGPGVAVGVVVTVRGYRRTAPGLTEVGCAWRQLSIVCSLPMVDSAAAPIGQGLATDDVLLVPMPDEGMHADVTATVSGLFADPNPTNNSRPLDMSDAMVPLGSAGAPMSSTIVGQAATAEATAAPAPPAPGESRLPWVLFGVLAVAGAATIGWWLRRYRPV